MRKVVRQLNEVEKALVHPHWVAYAAYQTLLAGMVPQALAEGVQYDPQAGQFFVTVPEPEPGE